MFERFIEVGRVIRPTSSLSEDKGKLAVVVEILDHNRVVVDGPTTGVKRQVLTLRRLELTSIKIAIPRGVRAKALTKAIEKEDIVGQWNKTSKAKKEAHKKRMSGMNDFERFKHMLINKKRNAIIGKEFAKLKETCQI